MKRPLLAFSILLLVSIASFLLLLNTGKTRFNTITSGPICIAVPEYLTPSAGIDTTALLQLENIKEQFVLLVWKRNDTVPKTPETAFRERSEQILAKTENGILIKYYPTTINGRQAWVGNIRGTVNKTRVYYRLAEIGSAGSAYEIILGVSDRNQSRYEKDMNTILQSFTILP